MTLQTAPTSPATANTATANTAPADAPQRRWGAPRCGYASSAAMLWVGSRFLWLGYIFVWLAALGFFLFLPRARRASSHYLNLVLPPHRRRNPLARAWQTYRHMTVYGTLLLDRALMLSTPGHGFHIEVIGLENMQAAAKLGMPSAHSTANSQTTGVIILTAHFGMAEIAAPYMQTMGLSSPMNIVMYQDHTDATERFHTRTRHMLAGMNVISTTDPLAAGLRIIAALRRGEFVALRADRTLAGKGVNVTLLGKRVELPAGPFTAAVLSGAPVLHIHCCRVGYRKYRCLISPPRQFRENPQTSREALIVQAAQSFAANLEDLLQQFPFQWANFYDFWQVQAAP